MDHNPKLQQFASDLISSVHETVDRHCMTKDLAMVAKRYSHVELGKDYVDTDHFIDEGRKCLVYFLG